MGLLDSILGNMMGAGGGSMQRRGGAASPIVQTLLMLLAAKAFQQNRTGPQGSATDGGLWDLLGGLSGMLGGGSPGGGLQGSPGNALPGGLGGLLGGLLGGGGASAGPSLGGLLDQLRQNGFGNQVDSWVGTGQNLRLAPDELSQALGPDTLDELEQQSGMPRQHLLTELSEELPDAVDQFTPDGRLPTEQEVSSRWV